MFTVNDYLKAKKSGGRYVGKKGSPRTLNAYRSALRKVEELLEMPIAEATAEDADRLMELLADASPSYQSVILSALKNMFAWGKGVGLVTDDPFEGIERPQIKQTVPTILSRRQLEDFFDAIDGEKYRLMFELMYYGGLRIGETVKLKRDDFLRERGIVVHGKGGTHNFVYLPEWLRKKIDAYMEIHDESPYIFYGDSNNSNLDAPMSLIMAHAVFNEARNSAKLPKKFRPHNLRATAATHVHEASGDLAITQKFLRHARPETTLRYAQIANERLEAAQQRAFEGR